jgi:hypothetical protein
MKNLFPRGLPKKGVENAGRKKISEISYCYN